jgi:hypothetical protein
MARLLLSISGIMAHEKHLAPDRTGFAEDGRETVALIGRHDQTINVVLVALTDGVELEIRADGALRRRLRFLRDTEARKYAERLYGRLARRGYALM